MGSRSSTLQNSESVSKCSKNTDRLLSDCVNYIAENFSHLMVGTVGVTLKECCWLVLLLEVLLSFYFFSIFN